MTESRQVRYNRSPKGRDRYRRYRASDKGRANERINHLRQRTQERTARIAQIEKELRHP